MLKIDDLIIDKEFEESVGMLEKYMGELDLAIERKDTHFELSEDDLDSLNSLYLDLIYKLHPSFNPVQSIYEKDLFEEIVEAFETYDLTSMRSLAILIPEGKTIFEDDDVFIKSISQINQEIYNIKNSYPYNKKKILDDEKLFKDYKIQLLDVVANDYLLIEEYGKKLDELYKLLWVSGCKTSYYLRTLAASNVEKSSITTGVHNLVSPVIKACSIDNPDCEACQ